MLARQPLKEVAGMKVVKTCAKDGHKYTLEDSSWLLIRPSGTEPLIRFHFEGTTSAKNRKLAAYCQKLINQLK